MSDPFEPTLRDWLARRAVVVTSPSLRGRIAAVPVSPAAPGQWARRRRVEWFARASIAAVVLAVAVWVVWRSPITIVGPGAGPISPPPSAVGIRPGDGLTSPTFRIETLLLVAALIAVLGFVARRERPHRIPTWVRFVMVLALVASALAIGRLSTTVGIDSQGSNGPGLGFVEDDPEDPRVSWYQPGPGGPISFVVAIVNDGPVPLTVQGLARSNYSQYYVALVALGRSGVRVPWDGTLESDPTKVDPFRPITLWPGDMAAVTVLGASGICATGPGSASPGSTGATFYAELPLVVGFLGFEWIDPIQLPRTIKVGQVDGCQVQDPIEVP